MRTAPRELADTTMRTLDAAMRSRKNPKPRVREATEADIMRLLG